MEAHIYDHARTPRGRGRADWALHEVPAVEIVTQLLQAIATRNSLDTALMGDVVVGLCSCEAQGQRSLGRPRDLPLC